MLIAGQGRFAGIAYKMWPVGGQDRRRDVLALQLAMDGCPVVFGITAMASVISSGGGQLRPAAWKALERRVFWIPKEEPMSTPAGMIMALTSTGPRAAPPATRGFLFGTARLIDAAYQAHRRRCSSPG